jgi:acid phosphatase (class A)
VIASVSAAVRGDELIRDHRTDSIHYFLEINDVADSKALLQPPPGPESVQFMYDKSRYDWGKSLRNTERGEQAFEDARVSGQYLTDAFSDAFGMSINEVDTPEIYRLIVGMREDAGDLSTRAAKDYYMRERPFSFFSEVTCNPEQQSELSTNGSYPSGHAAIGWATALVLAEINPARQTEILKRGLDIGDSRVICGYHYQSDIDAGRIVAAGVVARLHASVEFQKQLERAKREFAAKSVGNKK